MNGMPWQNPSEWRTFLGIVESYVKTVVSPIVVEVGVFENKQKSFYEALGLRHIGIDVDRDASPDILGDSHDLKTFEELKRWLGGQPITVLFIDACHSYEDVRQDYEMYSPLVRGIVAFHDIFNHKYDVQRFWEELISDPRNRDKTFVTIHAKEGFANHGIGLILEA